MKFFLISDSLDTATGMRLAGIEGVVVHEQEEVEAELEKAATDPEIAVVLITAKLVDRNRESINRRKLGNSRPLILEVPDRHGGSGASIVSYIQEAVGITL